MKPLRTFVSFLCMLCLLNPPARADEAWVGTLQQNIQVLEKTVGELKTLVGSQNEVIQGLNNRIQILEKGEANLIQTPVSIPDRAPKTGGISQGFNPDIGVVGTVQAQSTENTDDEEGKDTIALKELELSFSQVVDPYSRLDVILALNDNLEEQNIDIEEAYYTHWGLPAGFQGQIGKFRAKVGKQNLMHLHQLETVDYPEVIKDFFGDEGLASSGARLQNYVPNPWDIPIEVTGEVLRGNNGNLFGGISRRPIFNTHVKTFFEPAENLNLELGGTAMIGEENASGIAKGDDRFGMHVFGADATLMWYGPEGRTVKWQNEVFFTDGASNRFVNKNPWGFYSLVDIRFLPKWSTGVRFDYLEPTAVVGDHERTVGVSPYLTFWQSEFASFGVQYTHLEPADGSAKSDNIVFLEANFLIGDHKHPVQ